MGRYYSLTGTGARSARHVTEAQKSWLRWKHHLGIAQRELTAEEYAKCEFRNAPTGGGLIGVDKRSGKVLVHTGIAELRSSVRCSRALAQHAVRQPR